VFDKLLALFSKSPVTGYKRDGYCRTGPDDPGKHVVAGVVTDGFLDFSASKGNDLESRSASRKERNGVYVPADGRKLSMQ
jgi:uncharacterized protein